MKKGILSTLIITIGWVTSLQASTRIRCEIPDLSKSQDANQFLIITSEKNEKYDVKIQSEVSIMGKLLRKNRSLCPADHFTPKIHNANEIQLKYIKKINGQNLDKIVRLDLNQRRGHLIQERRQYALRNCEVD